MVRNPKSANQSTWKIKFAGKVLDADLRDVGHAAFDIAKKAIDKKLKLEPEKYGANLHHPLHGFRKLKTADIRIVYRVDAESSSVLILMIGNRRDIWDSEQNEILERYEIQLGREILSREPPARKRKER
jgi:mRNA interferase RelE/StbE